MRAGFCTQTSLERAVPVLAVHRGPFGDREHALDVWQRLVWQAGRFGLRQIKASQDGGAIQSLIRCDKSGLRCVANCIVQRVPTSTLRGSEFTTLKSLDPRPWTLDGHSVSFPFHELPFHELPVFFPTFCKLGDTYLLGGCPNYGPF